jgi:hypothetical protein
MWREKSEDLKVFGECEMLDIRRGWNEFSHHLGYYVAYGGLITTFRHYLSVSSSRVKLSKRQYEATLLNNPEDRIIRWSGKVDWIYFCSQ